MALSGYLRLLVLKQLSSREMSGYDLMKNIEKETGFWKPSAGSIYPLLNQLLGKGILDVAEEGRRRVYSLTKHGKQKFIEIKKNKDELADKMQRNMRVLECISD